MQLADALRAAADRDNAHGAAAVLLLAQLALDAPSYRQLLDCCLFADPEARSAAAAGCASRPMGFIGAVMRVADAACPLPLLQVHKQSLQHLQNQVNLGRRVGAWEGGWGGGGRVGGQVGGRAVGTAPRHHVCMPARTGQRNVSCRSPTTPLLTSCPVAALQLARAPGTAGRETARSALGALLSEVHTAIKTHESATWVPSPPPASLPHFAFPACPVPSSLLHLCTPGAGWAISLTTCACWAGSGQRPAC